MTILTLCAPTGTPAARPRAGDEAGKATLTVTRPLRVVPVPDPPDPPQPGSKAAAVSPQSMRYSRFTGNSRGYALRPEFLRQSGDSSPAKESPIQHRNRSGVIGPGASSPSIRSCFDP